MRVSWFQRLTANNFVHQSAKRVRLTWNLLGRRRHFSTDGVLHNRSGIALKSFEKLKQLILLEEFKSYVPVKVKTYLEEQKVNELQRAATLADDCKLTHQGISYIKFSLMRPPR